MKKNLVKGLVFENPKNMHIYEDELVNSFDKEEMSLRRQYLSQPHVGEINYNKFQSKLEILYYFGCKDIGVLITTQQGEKFIRYGCTYQNFQKGEITSPYDRRIQNIGYTGYGEYFPKRNELDQYFFNVFSNMINRIFNKNVHKLKPCYIGATLHPSWYDFQNFCYWCYLNYYQIDGELMCLDKDILYKGNKEYGPFTCCFVPQSINKLFTKRDKMRGDLPIGVTYSGTPNKPYSSYCSINGINKKFIGNYKTIEEAFYAYKEAKENEIKRVANEYYGRIPQELYDAMINCVVDIND